MRAPIIAVINQLRAFLLDRAIVLAKTPAKLRMVLDGFCCATAAVVSDNNNVLTKIRICRFIAPPIRQSG
jgi:hypothetical protein